MSSTQNKSLPGNSWLASASVSASSSSLSSGGSSLDTGAPERPKIVSLGMRWLKGSLELVPLAPNVEAGCMLACEPIPDDAGEYKSYPGPSSEGELSTSNGSGVGSRCGGGCGMSGCCLGGGGAGGGDEIGLCRRLVSCNGGIAPGPGVRDDGCAAGTEGCGRLLRFSYSN